MAALGILNPQPSEPHRDVELIRRRNLPEQREPREIQPLRFVEPALSLNERPSSSYARAAWTDGSFPTSRRVAARASSASSAAAS